MDGSSSGNLSANDAGALAAAALKAAQQAVSSLKTDSTPMPAASAPPDPELDDGMSEVLRAAQEAIAQAKAGNAPAQPAPAVGSAAGAYAAAPAQPLNLPSFASAPAQQMPSGIDLLSEVNLNVRIELGRTRMLVEDVLRLGSGSVVELDKLAGDPVDVYVNDRYVAKGEVLVLNDNFCVRINEIVVGAGEVMKPK